MAPRRIRPIRPVPTSKTFALRVEPKAASLNLQGCPGVLPLLVFSVIFCLGVLVSSPPAAVRRRSPGFELVSYEGVRAGGSEIDPKNRNRSEEKIIENDPNRRSVLRNDRNRSVKKSFRRKNNRKRSEPQKCLTKR